MGQSVQEKKSVIALAVEKKNLKSIAPWVQLRIILGIVRPRQDTDKPEATIFY